MNKTEFIYKVALAGEGKTKWLVGCAHAEIEAHAGNHVVPPVVFFTKVPRKYAEFAENYYARTHKLFACRIATSTAEIAEGDVVLIDDWQNDFISGKDLRALVDVASKVYITVEGKLDDNWDISFDPDQLSIFDTVN